MPTPLRMYENGTPVYMEDDGLMWYVYHHYDDDSAHLTARCIPRTSAAPPWEVSSRNIANLSLEGVFDLTSIKKKPKKYLQPKTSGFAAFQQKVTVNA